ncbi:MAG TPA: YdeI/OmpD-associated family protein [Candidatus Koribacter sp.]|jgi:hypothetical protein
MPDRDPVFRFRAKVERISPGGFYAVVVPVGVSRAAGKRGPVPVHAEINGLARFTASISPAGGGRHRLRINTNMRELAGSTDGKIVNVVLTILAEAPHVPLPQDLRLALEAEGAREEFETLAPGKQQHILTWIERSAREETRAKRIEYTVQFALEHQEKRMEREKKSAQKRKDRSRR